MFYKKELLQNMSQGARLRFIRENKGIELNDIAKYLGYKSNKPIREWENNVKSPDARNLPRLAEAYGVSIDAIKNYDFIDPIDEIYYPMWFEEQFPYYEFDNYHYWHHIYTPLTKKVIAKMRSFFNL